MLALTDWIRNAAFACLAVLLEVMLAYAQVTPSLEYQVKASFLYNISKYIYWSPKQFAEPASPLVICILGDDPFGTSMDELSGRRSQDRSIIVNRLEYPKHSNLLSSCHMLYLSRSLGQQSLEAEEILRSLPVLTIGDDSDRGIVTFMVLEGKVKLKINLRKAREAGLQISAHLLQLAEITEK